MSIFYVQEFGNSKGMIVELIHQKNNDVILRCVKDDFVFAISKNNFNKFYSDYDEHEEYAFNPSQEELDRMNVSNLGELC